jgi:hypothetical protein
MALLYDKSDNFSPIASEWYRGEGKRETKRGKKRGERREEKEERRKKRGERREEKEERRKKRGEGKERGREEGGRSKGKKGRKGREGEECRYLFYFICSIGPLKSGPSYHLRFIPLCSPL